MNKISYSIIILFTFIFQINAYSASCDNNFPKTGLTIQTKGNKERLIYTYRIKKKIQSYEDYREAYNMAKEKAKIALINKYKKLKRGNSEQYSKNIIVLGICTEPGNYLKVAVGRPQD